MRIVFTKRYNGYEYYHCGSWKVSDAIKALLEERFSRMVYMENHQRLHVKFLDAADEAAFLLWSSDGVDI